MVIMDFPSLSRYVKVKTINPTDNIVFLLHYKVTSVILLAFSLLGVSNQFFSVPIACQEWRVDIYCWSHSTFTLPENQNKFVDREEVAYQGVRKNELGEKPVYHNYYQWVAFVLFSQAIMFCLPRAFWNRWEADRVSSMVQNLEKPIMARKKRDKQMGLLLEHFKFSLRHNNTYFNLYFFCEVLSFANVILQMVLIDSFFGGAFSTYGFEMLPFTVLDQEDRWDPMVAVFPRITKCRLNTFGVGGSLQNHDTLCILPQNAVNEKVYIFLWFWFVFLSLLSGAVLIYRFAIILFKPLRKLVLRRRTRCAYAPHLNVVLKVSLIGDWFLLNLLSKNLDSQNWCKLIKGLSEHLLNCQKASLDEKQPVVVKNGDEIRGGDEKE